MDVRQFAFLARQPSSALKSRDSFFGLPKRGLALILANALFWQPLLAQAEGIVVSGPGTTVGQAGNGVPVVNIASPNGSGLSHNQFKDYNVGPSGVILNNATGRTQSTQLGGIILGNPNLAGGAANIILNEVNGGSPSQLRGYTEVAGQSAKVIVANPYGISCNGCGFINTPNVTLTTGKPILDNGRLDRYQVDGGAVTIDGQGLNASNVDRFEIITRTAKINAQINARNLTVIAGRNDVNAQTLNATARADDGSAKPELAIDSSALGGMYAGAIKLVGTEAGVGVKLDGTLAASGGDIQLDANGHLSMAQAAASGAVNIKAASLDAQGPIYAGTALDVQTQGDLNSRKTLAARDSITLSSGGQLTNNGIIEAGVNADNTRNTTGDASLTAQTLNNTGNSVIASRALTVNAQALNNQGGTLSAKQSAKVTAATLDNQNKGRVLSNASLEVKADRVLNAQGGLITSSGPLTATLGELNNRGGEVSSLDIATLNVATLDNVAGLVTAGNALSLTTSGTVNNQGGTLSSQGTLALKAGAVDNSAVGRIASNLALTANVASLNNNGGRLTSGNVLNLDLNGGQLNNQGGLVSGWKGLNVSGASLDNRNNGTLSSRYGDLNATFTGSLLNSGAGALVSQKALTVTAAELDNSDKGILTSAGSQTLTVSGLLNNAQGGVIDSGAALNLTAQNLDNSAGNITSGTAATLGLLATLTNTNGKLSSAGPLLITRAAQINNQGGQLASQGLLTLLTGGLDNRNRGTVAANERLTLTASGVVQNGSDGLIYSQNADLKLTANRLDNAKGAVQSQAGLTLEVAGDIDNQSGKLIAQAGDLSANAASLDNRGGVLSSLKGALQSRVVGVLRNGYDLNNNRQGGIVQGQSLNLLAGAVDNYGGRISAQSGNALVTTGNFDNRNGGLYAKGLVSVTGHDFDNSGDNDGQITGQQIDLNLSGALNNRLGIIESESTLKVSAASLDNQTGRLRALGSSGTTEFAIGGLFDNRNGLLETANNDLILGAGSLQNAGGTVLHVGIGRFDIAPGNLNSVGGSLVTRGDLTVNQDTWTNSSVIQADRLTVNVNQLDQTTGGQLLAAQRFIGSGGNWSTNGLIASDGSLDLTLSGALNSTGRISSLGNLNVSAAQLNLSNTASIAGGGITTANITGTLNNYGRLTSTTDLNLTAGAINNYATLGSGQNLTATTGALLNDHGLIFSGGDMGLRVDTLNNSYADIYSMGNLSIDRDGKGGLASSIINSSSNIQSDGSLSLAASTIKNLRSVLTTNDGGIYTASITEFPCQEGPNYAGDCSGGKENHLWQVVQRDKFEVTDASAASSISAGKNLTITGGDLLNASSSIGTAGNLNITVNNLTNSGIETGETETWRLFMSERTRDASGWYSAAEAFNNRYSSTGTAYNPKDLSGLEAAMASFIGMTEQERTALRKVTKIDSGDQRYAAVIQAAGAATVKVQGSIDNSVVRPGFNYVGAGAKTATDASGASAANSFSTRITINQQLPPELAQQQINPLSLPGFSLPAGQGGLFRLSGESSAPPANTGPQSWTLSGNSLAINRVQGLPDSQFASNPQKYLIETNPLLTNLRQFMGSDYLLSKLGYDPDQAQKRLGDGLYEQRLIQQAVIARTGQRFIDGQTSDASMFKYLMDNAIGTKQRLNLSVGVSLTAEQVAALTHDIVWMENATVDGQQVLVPVLYLAQANNRLAPNGALISGSDLSLMAGANLDNVGTLRATQNLAASAGRDMVNSGLIEAGNRLDLLAGNNLTNRAGGIIAGRDVSVAAINGDVLNERSITSHQSSSGYRTERSDFVDSAARIEAANNLSLGAGRDINSAGGVLKSGADTVIQAGRDVNLTSSEQRNANAVTTRSRSDSVTQYGTVIEAGRDFQIVAARDISAIGSQIDAKRDLAMAATGNLTLASAANEQHSAGNTKKVKSQEDHVQQVSTTLKAGGDVTLSAGQDLALVASTVNAGDEAYLVAGKNLALKAAEDQDYSLYSKTKKTSSGKKFRLDETDSTTNVGSLVSSGGNSTLVAGENLLLAGSAVTAEKGAATLVAGKDVQILAVTDSDSARHERKESKSSWGGFKSSKVQDKVDEASTTAVGSMVSGETVSVAAGQDVKVTGSSLVSTGDLAVQAGRDLTIDAAQNTFSRTDMHKEKNRDLTGVLTGNKLGLDDMTGNQHLSISSQKHNGTATETTLTGSTIGSSAGNVTLTAGRELSVKASDLVSTKDMSLNGANVTIAAGTETANQTSEDSSKSLAVGRVVGGTIVDTAKSIRNDVRAAQQADDSRLKAVKGAQALLSAYNAMSGDDSAANESDGRPANSKGSVIKIGTELASTRKKSTSEYNAETVKQSTLNSGGSLAIVATGNAPDTKGDIHVIGSSIKANDTLLLAKNNITLESAQDRRNWDNQNTTNKTSIGASFNIGEQFGFTLDLGAKTAKDMGAGHDVTQVNSTVDTGLLVLKSGQDTTLAGAQVRADAIKADIGGHLNIASRQDEASQKNKQTSGGVGVSICVPPFCLGSMVSGSAEFAGNKMNSDYRAVTDQTGLFAGKGGYDINVGKNTTLEGAVIASEASNDKNYLSTDRLLISDIKNKSDIKSQAASLSYSGATEGTADARSGVGGTMPLMLKDSDSSKTRSAVSPGTIIVRDAAGANDLVGLSRDTANANKHLDRPDEKAMQERIDLIQSSAQLSSSVISMVGKAKADEAKKLRKQAEAQADAGSSDAAGTARAADAAYAEAQRWQVGGDKKMMADIASGLIAAGLGGATGGTAVGIVANTSSSDIFNKIGDFANAQRDKSTDSTVKAAWGEGGAARILLHALAGAAIGLSSGSVESGALGAGASAALMPFIGKALSDSAMTVADQNALASLIATGVGAAVGSSNGVNGAVVAGGAANGVEAFNRQLHKQQEIPVLEKKAEELEKTLKSGSSSRWIDLLMIAAGGAVDVADEARLNQLVLQSQGNDTESQHFAEDLNVAKGIVAQLAAQKIPLTWSNGSQITADGEKVFAFGATEKQFNDSTLFNAAGLYGPGAVYEQWRQYGQEQTSQHSGEISKLSSYDSSVEAAAQRLSVLAGKGIVTVSPELDAAMLLMPGAKVAKTAIETILEKMAARKAAGGAKATGEVVPPAPIVTSGATRTGVVRTNAADWRALRDNWDDLGYGQILSTENRAAIAKGRTPKVDDAWVKVFPEDAGLKGERIPMHHVQGSPLTVPLPDTRHLDAHMPGGFRYNPGGPGSALPAYPPKKGAE